MERFVIQGQAPLSGTIAVNGAKNHVLKLIPAAFLVDGPTTITNVPQVSDVMHLLDIAQEIGAGVEWQSDSTVVITPPDSIEPTLSEELVPKLRASVVLLGPLLARYGAVRLPYPGGDNIGKRPIDFFIDGLVQLGAEASYEDDAVYLSAPTGLSGTSVIFPRISVTGTESLLMAACLASGETVLQNVAIEPEVVALAEWLRQQGADISGIGTHTVTIRGGALLSSGSVAVVPDRIEAASFIILAAASNSEVSITNCDPSHMAVPLHMLQTMGVPMTISDSSVTVHMRSGELQPIDVVTHEYPGFATDMQPPMMVLLTQAAGVSNVRETIFDGRLFYTEQLNAMNAGITLLDPYRAQVNGSAHLIGTTVESLDIRAGIALLIAGAIAEGETTIYNIHHIDRGYHDIEKRLQAIGMQIQRKFD